MLYLGSGVRSALERSIEKLFGKTVPEFYPIYFSGISISAEMRI
jgi:hypothetical protein